MTMMTDISELSSKNLAAINGPLVDIDNMMESEQLRIESSQRHSPHFSTEDRMSAAQKRILRSSRMTAAG